MSSHPVSRMQTSNQQSSIIVGAPSMPFIPRAPLAVRCVHYKLSRVICKKATKQNKKMQKAWNHWTIGPIATITTTTIVCLPGSRQGIWARSSTMNQAQTPGWPPWPGIRPNRIKRYRIGHCSLSQLLFHRLTSHRYLEHRRLDHLNPLAAI